jgi:hypothetical protein
MRGCLGVIERVFPSGPGSVIDQDDQRVYAIRSAFTFHNEDSVISKMTRPTVF